MGGMANIDLGAGKEVRITHTPELALKFEPEDLSGLVKWVVGLINSKQDIPGFKSQSVNKIIVGDEEPEYIEVDQSNSSYRYGNYLVKIRKKLDLTNRSIRVLSALSKSRFENTPKYFGHVELEVFGKSVEFITVYEFIEDSTDGWTWAPQKLVSKDLYWVNQLGQICAEMHRDLKSIAIDENINYLEVSEKLINDLAYDYKKPDNYDFQGYPDPDEVFGLWHEISSKYFAKLKQKKDSLSFSNKNNQMTHGDFHVGQILKVKENYIIIDFDGSPVLQAETKNGGAPIESDVAHFLTSISLAARVGERINKLEYGQLNDVVKSAQDSFLMSYQNQAQALGLIPLDLALVEYLSLRQYLFEIIYAQKYLPRWIYAPVISLQQELG
jgi:maltokinase